MRHLNHQHVGLQMRMSYEARFLQTTKKHMLLLSDVSLKLNCAA